MKRITLSLHPTFVVPDDTDPVDLDTRIGRALLVLGTDSSTNAERVQALLDLTGIETVIHGEAVQH